MYLNDGEKDNQKIELVVNHQDQGTYELDLVEVFRNMGKTSGIFVRIMCLALVAAMAGSMCLAALNKDSGTAQTMLNVLYTEYEEDARGNKTELPIEDISFSSYVIDKAINKVGLDDVLTSDVIYENLTISRVLTEESQQNLELMQQSIDAGKTSSLEMANVELEYTNQFLVTLKNGFGKDSTDLSSQQLTNLLNSIVDCYTENIIETKGNIVLPQKTLDADELADLDYLKILEIIRSSMSTLEEYCIEKMEDYPNYRSVTLGTSFSGVADVIAAIQENEIESEYAQIYYNGYYKDPSTLITSYNYDISLKKLDLDQINTRISNINSIISNYQNETILLMQDEVTSTEAVINTDYYNNLFLEQIELYEERAELITEINRLQAMVDSINVSNAYNAEEIESSISALLTRAIDVEEFVYDYAKEFADSDTVLGSFISSSSALYNAESLFSAGNIKSAAIAGAVGAFLVVCVWGCYAIAIEFKKGEKRNEVQI